MFPEPFPPQHPVRHTPVIWHPAAERNCYSSVFFRREFTLHKPLRNIRLWVSASQRFELFVDGRLIARGPSRSDPDRWNCPQIKIPHLTKGKHIIAARVRHYGKYGGKAQLGGAAFFLLTARRSIKEPPGPFDTAAKWLCLCDRSVKPLYHHKFTLGGIQTGAGEKIDARHYPWGWNTAGYDATAWDNARIVLPALFNLWGNRTLYHELRPDPLPLMEEKIERFERCFIAAGRKNKETEHEYKPCSLPLRIADNHTGRIVLDRGELTNAYPAISISGGKDAVITIVSAEAPRMAHDLRIKGNRAEIDGKVFRGTVDQFLPDGEKDRIFTTGWFRSFRYLVLDIKTRQDPLTINHAECLFSGYPLRRRSRINISGPEKKKIKKRENLSWHTQRLCSHETFFDCPHYEQGQFPGDTRIQAVYHYLIANDDRLARKAIDDFHASRNPEGLLSSHHPLNSFHAIPTFSLQWIGMLHDFLLYRGELEFLNRYLPAAREILAWFERKIDKTGMLGFIPDAPFIDWSPAFSAGNAPQDSHGHSAILSLLYARASNAQAELEAACGFPELAPRFRAYSAKIIKAVNKFCWNRKQGLLADTAQQKTFSLHTQVEAVLAGMWSEHKARTVLQHAMQKTDITLA